MYDRILIEKNRIPYRFDILLAGDLCTLAVNYNAHEQIFTVSLYRSGALICADEPIVYGVPLFTDCYQIENYPCLTIVPLDESGRENAVTFKNFGETVFLSIIDGVEEVG